MPASHFEQLSLRLKEGRRRLHRELAYYPKLLQTLTALPARGQNLREVLITSGEVNDRHGSGLLLSRLFSADSAFNIHARSFYETPGSFTAVEIANDGRGDQFASFILREIAGLLRIEHILAVPYMPDEAHTALALKEASRAPLVTWVMDDQAVFSDQLPKPLLQELFARSDIRFVISPEMKQAYQKAFDLPFFVLPPTVSQSLLNKVTETPSSHNESKCCALIGNVWSASWLALLESMIAKSGWNVHWYGQDPRGSESRPGFISKGFVSESELAKGLAAMPFAIAPIGTGDEKDDRIHITKLSLPSRIPYLLAVHRMPILVIGSEESCAARFVRRMGVGLSCNYSPEEFQAAAQRLCEPGFNACCRANCARHAALFGDEAQAQWIWQSAHAGSPIDSRFAIFDPQMTQMDAEDADR